MGTPPQGPLKPQRQGKHGKGTLGSEAQGQFLERGLQGEGSETDDTGNERSCFKTQGSAWQKVIGN